MRLPTTHAAGYKVLEPQNPRKTQEMRRVLADSLVIHRLAIQIFTRIRLPTSLSAYIGLNSYDVEHICSA